MVWDFSFCKRLHHGRSSFQLDVRVASSAARLVLFGPSGAGKTQALAVIAGISRADRGHGRIAGRTLFDSAQRIELSPPQRRLGCVFQDYALFPHLTVRQNIAFGLSAGWLNPGRGFSRPEVERWLATFHLGAVADHHPHQISGGQRQRTALARALVNRPAALLLDEPFAALDKPLRRRLRQELAELQGTLAVPMLLITHDEEDLPELGDEVVMLDEGRVVDPAQAVAP